MALPHDIQSHYPWDILYDIKQIAITIPKPVHT